MKTKSLRAKFLKYFLLYSAAILAVVWLLQVVFLNFFYQSMKKRQIERAAKGIIAKFGAEDYDDIVERESFYNDFTTIIFRISGDRMETLHGSHFFGEYVWGKNLGLERFISEVDAAADGRAGYMTDERPGYETYTYGEKLEIEGAYYYFFFNSPLAPIKSTTGILAVQLIFVTILSLGLAAGLAFLLARRLSSPITAITKEAGKLAGGNFSARFEAKGYSEIEDLSCALSYATEELRNTDSLRRDLIANTAHDFRTPLTLIQSYAEMIRDLSGNNPKKREQHLATILLETERLKTLVSDSLDLSRLESGTAEFRKTAINLSALIRYAAESFAGAYPDFRFKLKIEEGARIFADGKKIEQVLYNLIGNAVNYTGADKTVRITLAKTEDGYRLDVIDTGEGVTAGNEERIFGKYFRAGAVSRSQSGSGLGLYISKNILDAHGFEIGVVNTTGKGADFFVIFKKA